MWLFLLGAAIIGLYFVLVLPCQYTLTRDELRIRAGWVRMRVPLEQIRRVEPTSSLLSAPALSLSRLAVITDRKTYRISPADQDGFLAELHRRLDRPV